VVEISTERFRALARSSPWRWSTLRFVEQGDPGSGEQGPVRVLVRRPKMARLERLDGTLLRVIREEPTAVTPLTCDGDAQPFALARGMDLDVEIDADGLIVRRPSDCDTDTAMIRNYYDVALLDPVELADGDDGDPGATIEGLHEVEHHGRRAWESGAAADGFLRPSMSVLRVAAFRSARGAWSRSSRC
jgi:hypothetical protein